MAALDWPSLVVAAAVGAVTKGLFDAAWRTAVSKFNFGRHVRPWFTKEAGEVIFCIGWLIAFVAMGVALLTPLDEPMTKGALLKLIGLVFVTLVWCGVTIADIRKFILRRREMLKG